MNLYLITRKGNAVQNDVHTMVVCAQDADTAKRLALEWRGSKNGFTADRIEVRPIEMDKEQIILIQSL